MFLMCSEWFGTIALALFACGSPAADQIDDLATDGGFADTDVASTAPDTQTSHGFDTRGQDPACHYDCFGGLRCVDGVVSAILHAPVPCEYWTGECPTVPFTPPIQCPYGCSRQNSFSSASADPMSLCQPCPDPAKTGPACDQCADPMRTGPDCSSCIDSQTHGPACDQCLGGPGSNGCPCEEHDDCWYKICLKDSSSEGRRCAKGCTEDAQCPTGFVCSLKDTGYPSACTPVEGYLCQHCATDEDCEIPGHWNVICADVGLAGKRCTRLCSQPCPSGFSCNLGTWGGNPAEFCVPNPSTACE